MKLKVLFLILSLFFTQAFAQMPEVTPSSNVKMNPKGKTQTLNFEDELIEGNVQKPDLFYIFQKKNFNYKRLIKLRENFLPEMRKTTEDIQRVRGGH
jgi:hypothetical protein